MEEKERPEKKEEGTTKSTNWDELPNLETIQKSRHSIQNPRRLTVEKYPVDGED